MTKLPPGLWRIILIGMALHFIGAAVAHQAALFQ